MGNRIFSGILCAMLIAGCTAQKVERGLMIPAAMESFGNKKIADLKASSPVLKAHMKSGSVYVLHTWSTSRGGDTISGAGILYNSLRDTSSSGRFVLGLDSVAIFETNLLTNSGSMTAFTVFGGITAAMTAYCLANPKTCFGSCPTFYVMDHDSLRLQAEGFSSSISPALEATDVDALYRAKASGGEFKVEMRNEALETHVVRHVDLLAVPRRSGCRVFADRDNRFWESPARIAPQFAQGEEGNCLPALREFDGIERFSLAGDTSLGEKENIDLRFSCRPGRSYGLVIACRQTLLPTYLLYQTYAYMGNDVGHWLAEIERGSVPKKYGRVEGVIGGIDVSVMRQDGQRQPAGVVDEHGPLAVDTHLLPLPPASDTILDIRLRMTKGTWRIDYIALAELADTLSPIRLHPSSVLKDGEEDHEALRKLLAPSDHLVTLPGDTYILKYSLPPEHQDYELFLESRGYYLEWIRKEWVAEENPVLLGQLFLDPEGALKRLAPEFKRVEPQMEDCFWRSRYAKP